MSSLDRMLDEKRKEYEKLKAPDSLESNLRKALEGKNKKNKFPLSKIAAIFVIGAILTYNSSTLAYYGKQLIGYETVMDGTLLELNRLGEGQSIDKSHLFSDGIEVQVDGVMLDGNGMVLFYTIEDKAKSGNIDDVYVRVLPDILFMNVSSSGAGEILEEEHMQKWVFTTDEAPPFYVRTVTLELVNEKDDGIWEYGEIKFKLDRNKAVGDTIRVSIDKKVELAGRNMTIEDISMSPISTVVKGEIQDIVSLGLDRARNEHLMPQNLEMILFADGKEVVRKGSGMSTDMKGTRFDVRFDTIPKETKEIELVLDEITVSQNIGKEFSIAEGQEIEVLQNTIQIDQIEKRDGKTLITITTEEGTRIPGVNLIADGRDYELLETSESSYEKKQDEVILNTRTLEFEGTGDELKLFIGDIRYTKEYGLTVYNESIE
ncbi:DUF4179 domain-containing protein [Gudongella sp. DL1XJH-153]|uniref:DUF4179 domain-containing protein n=1 Tax=Gudongella sp. DL1XJH-153 TaxID=3409804 RepID=UPI003BB4A62D